MQKEPANVVFLAAELARWGTMPSPTMISSNRCAYAATEACAIGRSFTRIAEKLCGGEEEWGRWSEAVERAQARAERRKEKLRATATALLDPFGCKVTGESLHLRACVGGQETVLR
jgi:hypothetical protein